MKRPTHNSKKSTSIKAFSWHIQKFPRSSYDSLTDPWLCFSDGSAALLLSALTGRPKGSPGCWLCSTAPLPASLALTATSHCILSSHILPATLLSPLLSKGIMNLKADCVGKKKTTNQHMRNHSCWRYLLSEMKILTLHLDSSWGNSFPLKLQRSAGDWKFARAQERSSVFGLYTCYLFKAVSWVSY